MHIKEFCKNYFEKFKEKEKDFVKFYPAVFFAVGFLFDIFTLSDVDNWVSITQQFIYIFISSFILKNIILENHGLWRPTEKFQKIWSYKTHGLHFFLGGLLSIYTLFYFVSSSFSVSLFFLIIMFAVLVFNETHQAKNLSLDFKFGIYYICQNSFLLFLFPLLIGTVSVIAFLLALIVSLLITYIDLKFMIKRGIERKFLLNHLLLPNIVIVGVLLFLYLAKVLPPVPLSVKYMGIYHSIEKEEGKYKLGFTRSSWKFWQNGDQSFEAHKNDKIICFVNIFAPSSISQNIVFHWQIKKESKWVTADKVKIPIIGGRKNGYRGYMQKSNYEEGDWRVVLENEDGREISRIRFSVQHSKEGEDSEGNEEVETRFDYR